MASQGNQRGLFSTAKMRQDTENTLTRTVRTLQVTEKWLI